LRETKPKHKLVTLLRCRLAFESSDFFYFAAAQTVQGLFFIPNIIFIERVFYVTIKAA
jgi:hypothetical protein